MEEKIESVFGGEGREGRGGKGKGKGEGKGGGRREGNR